MKILSIILLFIINIQAAEVLKIGELSIDSSLFKKINYHFNDFKVFENKKMLIDFAKTYKIDKEIIEKDKEYSVIKEKLKNKNLNIVEKTLYEFYYWKEIKLKTYKISEEDRKLFYKKNKETYSYGDMLQLLYLKADTEEEAQNIINEITFSYKKILRMKKIAKRTKQKLSLKWYDKVDFKIKFNDILLFSNLYNIKKETLFKEPIQLNKDKKYYIFYIVNKLKDVKNEYKDIKKEMDMAIKEERFYFEYKDRIKEMNISDIKINIENLKKISK